MKNGIFTYAVVGLIIFAVIGAFSNLITDPIAVLKGLGYMIVTVAVILLLVKLFYKPSPERREQRAFLKAAKRTTKKGRANRPATKMKLKPTQKQSSVTSFKKMKIRKKADSNPNLTVIEGRKGKKKNRASF